jgi:16S rRNA A1518/A1519 N6-dimethyltransferase RsmA/KsgA/DIM1 with predicted DNA glycosylase/AP lyase activity
VTGTWQTSDAQAWTVRCPKCGSYPGTPCTYVLPSNFPPPPHTERQMLRLAAVGLPTQKVHNERRHEYGYQTRKRAHQERLKAALAEGLKVRTAVSQSAIAYRHAHSNEMLQMRDWLRENYALFGLTKGQQE